jgi:hypothetical protein
MGVEIHFPTAGIFGPNFPGRSASIRPLIQSRTMSMTMGPPNMQPKITSIKGGKTTQLFSDSHCPLR